MSFCRLCFMRSLRVDRVSSMVMEPSYLLSLTLLLLLFSNSRGTISGVSAFGVSQALLDAHEKLSSIPVC